ncbi:MAG: hypothetical protein HYS56_02020 [Candidatus Omnitrophica bacterium]|nr:hypothetical protein [Candidatus Omnitrophota bacterium]
MRLQRALNQGVRIKRLSAKEIERNVLAVLQSSDFVRQLRLYGKQKPWKHTRTSNS